MKTVISMKRLLFASFLLSTVVVLTQCRKQDCKCDAPALSASTKLAYGDSVFYLRNTEYTIAPLGNRKGTYSAFPDNLQMDPATGHITVGVNGNDGNSQTGMWYKIKFRSDTGAETDSTMVLLSGLTYVDAFYNLKQNDSIIYPIYNADPTKAIPPGNYDLKGDDDFAINPANGQINIKECFRRGFFTKEANGEGWKTAKIRYAINDKSNGATNSIDVVLYYYRTMDDVPSNVSALMQAHQRMTLGFATARIPSTPGRIDNNLPSDLTLSKPRPPCVVIVGN